MVHTPYSGEIYKRAATETVASQRLFWLAKQRPKSIVLQDPVALAGLSSQRRNGIASQAIDPDLPGNSGFGLAAGSVFRKNGGPASHQSQCDAT